MCKKRGATLECRNKRKARDTLILFDNFTRDKCEDEATDIIGNFSMNFETCLKFESQIRKFPSKINHWADQALKVI